jgi:hypothetical protein
MNAGNIFIFLVLASFLIGTATAVWPTDYLGMRAKAVKFTGRLLCLVQSFSAPIILMFLMFGAMRYLMADDPSDALAGRKLVMDAVMGGFCILIFIGVAGALGVSVDCGS